ncbi:hypothetical protein P879_10593 [Paragonimus westermani]|uniref:Uncharacterized protein n=1 Tax=Paragonimus westermani TaxID=34504 RepID=A0A8T0D563_9TREM|nr:hypothetical protein P879_10593 [Paragonimus westermani]
MNVIRQRNAEACRMWRHINLPRPQSRRLEDISSETLDIKNVRIFRIIELKAIQKEVQRLRKQTSHSRQFIQFPLPTANYTRRQWKMVRNKEKDTFCRVPMKAANKRKCNCTGCCLNSQCCPKVPQQLEVVARRTHALAGPSD